MSSFVTQTCERRRLCTFTETVGDYGRVDWNVYLLGIDYNSSLFKCIVQKYKVKFMFLVWNTVREEGNSERVG